ncbi:nuclease-related domain-containing DEAD/DEAH box helicase [Actinomycetospora atypica]|uniref:NERD domain-containing protein n=1 Tax=Actinomycetospora atypica TaxID=1290095 RepID=A0ABV9YGY9_9PSEU
MARMIPPIMPEGCPPGERMLFERFASDPSTAGWSVLHSLDIARHRRQVQGEADFVVVAPGLGVAVIEVKSHRSIRREENGTWVLGSQPPRAKSPFQQASDEMHSIRDYLQKRRVALQGTPIVFAVWFTHIRARRILPTSPEWHPWQLLDRDDLEGGPGSAVSRTLEAGRKHLRDRVSGLQIDADQPSSKKTAAIVSALRPKFELATTANELKTSRSRALSSFLEEQYDALDAMAEERTVIFTGPAGSGKTFLAVEACRREVSNHATGLLLCFNSGLGRHLERTVQIAGLEVSTLHRFMLQLTKLQVPESPTDEFWTNELPNAAVEILLDAEYAYDFLVVDEIQDVCSPQYLDVLDLLVKGGLAGGRCLYFGDFDRQAIYGARDGRDVLKSRAGTLVSYKLSSNCRNLPRIGHTVEYLSNMEPGYARFRRQDDGQTTKHYWYKTDDQQVPLLIRAVRELRDEGFTAGEIVILSLRAKDSAAARCDDSWLSPQLSESTEAPANRIRTCTVHSFKGLESAAVVLTDIDDSSRRDFADLLYIGLSRATDRLVILATRDAIGSQVLPERTF